MGALAMDQGVYSEPIMHLQVPSMSPSSLTANITLLLIYMGVYSEPIMHLQVIDPPHPHC